MKSIGIIGSGIVAKTLAMGFKKKGYQVVLGTREPMKLADWSKENQIPVLGMTEAGSQGKILVLAVSGKSAESALSLLKQEDTKGKIVIDVTNPISDEKPDQGVIRYFTPPNYSLMEQLQEKFPLLHFVKAFNSVGNAYMVDPKFPEGKPTMFYCGNDENAKKQVGEILSEFGWIPKDVGFAPSARPLEALCQLWCAPGFLFNQWNHAFHLMVQK